MIWQILLFLALGGIVVLLARGVPRLRRPSIASVMDRLRQGFPRRDQTKPATSDQQPPTGQPLREQADQYFRMKEYEKARPIYEQLILRHPDDATLLNRAGMMYLELKIFGRAVEMFRRTIDLNPKIAARYFNLGIAYLGLQDFKRALAQFRKALGLEPRNKKYIQIVEQTEQKVSS